MYTSFSSPQDQHSIMCAWAIKDFAPRVKLHVQILHPDNRLHLGVADHVVCEGELRNALLASNAVCPGISTLVSTVCVSRHQHPSEYSLCPGIRTQDQI